MAPKPNNDPSPRKSAVASVVNDDRVAEEVAELFDSNRSVSVAPGANADDFIAKTSRTKVAIIIPMFGYWQDVKDSYLDEEILEASLERARSYSHNAYIILLAEPQRLPPSAAKVINSKYIAGNARGVAMPVGSSYGDYMRKGMQVALTETDAAFFIFLNPWTVIQERGVDTLIDRINIPDNAPVICGYDMREKLTPEQFLTYKSTVPVELMMLTFNFFGMNRYIAEMCPLDGNLTTQAYLERDFFQSVASRNYTAVSSERVPIFSFDVDWRQYIPKEDYDTDAQTFLSKWKFAPDDIRYE